MRPESLLREHREIDAALDRLSGELLSGRIDECAFRNCRELLFRHYAHEVEFLAKLATDEPVLSAKLTAQHDEALEIADRLEECLSATDSRDVLYLLRRLLAIARHNMIEEERDVFPIAGWCFPRK